MFKGFPTKTRGGGWTVHGDHKKQTGEMKAKRKIRKKKCTGKDGTICYFYHLKPALQYFL